MFLEVLEMLVFHSHSRDGPYLPGCAASAVGHQPVHCGHYFEQVKAFHKNPVQSILEELK